MQASIEKIKELRKRTNISIAECRKALENTKGDLEKALEILKKRGTDILTKKKNRKTLEGLIGTYLHPNKKIGSIVKVSCESDFVARNEEFQKFVHEIAMQVTAMDPKDIKELLSQPYIKEVEKTVKDLLEELVAKLGENIKIDNFKRLEV